MADCDRKPVVIFGTGQIAEVALHYFRHDAGRTVAACTVDAAHLDRSSLHGTPVVPFEDVEKAFSPEDHAAFVAVSYADYNRLRAEKCRAMEAKGYALTHFVSARAQVAAGFTPEPNVFIFENNVIQPYAVIGRNTTLWSGNHVGHHAHIGSDVFLASQVVVSGNVAIGENTFVGINASIREGVRIGRRCLVGAGALVLQDLPDGAVCAPHGTPPAPFDTSRIAI